MVSVPQIRFSLSPDPNLNPHPKVHTYVAADMTGCKRLIRTKEEGLSKFTSKGKVLN